MQHPLRLRRGRRRPRPGLRRLQAARGLRPAAGARRPGTGPAPLPGAGQAEDVRRVEEAWESEDIAALVDLLDLLDLLDLAAVMTADGGGLVGTVLRPWLRDK